MCMASVIDSPFGRVPVYASRWDHGGTETCGGGKSVSGLPLVFWEYLRIYRGGIRLIGITGESRAQEAPLPPGRVL